MRAALKLLTRRPNLRSGSRPRRGVLPYTKFLLALRVGQIPPAIPIFQFQLVQVFEMPTERLTDQRGSIHLMSLRRQVGGLQELSVQDYLYRLH